MSMVDRLDIGYIPDNVEVFRAHLDADDFEGACVDTGATESVIGREQAMAYSKSVDHYYTVQGSHGQRFFTFGKQKVASTGRIQIRIPVNEEVFLPVTVDVVDLPIPFLLGLNTMDKFGMYANTFRNFLVCEDEKEVQWEMPLIRMHGHVYLTWENQMLYTTAELRKIHRHFYHPHPDRIYSLLKRAGDPEATPKTLKELEDLTSSCEVFQRLAREPGRMRVSLPSSSIVFNRVVLMDIMSLEGKRALHIVDKDTLFSAAAFLSNGESTKHVWDTYVRQWVNPYVGYSQEIHDNQGPQFQSSEWRSLLSTAGIKRRDSGIERHNALGAGETYHEYLRQIYRKVRTEHLGVTPDHALSLSVHAMNCIAGPNGLSPSLLVFGVLPRMPVMPTELPEQRERMKAMQKARMEMTKRIAKSRIARARSSNVPAAADNDIRVGMKVLFYRERPANKWTGPFKVIAVDAKQVWIDVGDRVSLVSIDKLKEYKPDLPDIAEDTDHDDAQEQPQPLTSQEEYGRLLDEVITAGTLFAKLGEAISHIAKKLDSEKKGSSTRSKVFLTDVLDQQDPRISSPVFASAKLCEIDGLIGRGAFRTVKFSHLPKEANILGGRFVCAIKNAGKETEVAKARFVAQGHKDRDRENPFIAHNLATLRQSSTKIIVSCAPVLGWIVYTNDVKQAYLQSKEILTRTIYLKPKDEDRKLFRLERRRDFEA